MIDSTSQQVSRARSNTARPLALFLTLSVIAHGLYFPQEVILLGLVLSGYVLIVYLYRRVNLVTGMSSAFGLTDALFLGMLLFSVLGLVHPIKIKDGIIEAMRWTIFWLAYRLGRQISLSEAAKEYLVQRVEWLAIAVAFLGWVPWVSKVAGRLSSVFGYPNATAAFLGTVLLLYPRRKLVRIFLAISLLGTGSRAGVGLFGAVFMVQQYLMRVRGEDTRKQLRDLWVVLPGIAGAIFMVLYYRPAWENLMDWGFSSSSWLERLTYFKDGISLAWKAGGYPQAGGWMAFPTVQHFPYWTADPHSSFIHILLNQGFIGIISVGIWCSIVLVQSLKAWGKNRVLLKSAAELEAYKAQGRMWGALLFLGLHSLVDADFSFGSLGLLFWMLYGSMDKKAEYSHFSFLKKHKFIAYLSGKGMLVLSLSLCLLSGSALLNPALLEKEQGWNAQARLWREQDPDKSCALWNLSLNWDQTQIVTRRDQAELLLKQGNMDSGLKAVEEVLNWQPFDLRAYEWAQSVVWDAAEVNRYTRGEKANILYQWVEDVPGKIDEKVTSLTSSERLLWKGYHSFLSSEHIKLLADYARQRQLTQLLPRT